MNTHDVEVKLTHIIEDRFFSNITVRNYRGWAHDEPQGLRRLPREKAVERGIEIIGDFNDRYGYNQDEAYSSDEAVVRQIVERGFTELSRNLARLGSDTN